MYYFCPECNLRFTEEEKLVKHYLQCWKEKHPYQESKPAPRSEDINTREVSDDIANFFKSFK